MQPLRFRPRPPAPAHWGASRPLEERTIRRRGGEWMRVAPRSSLCASQNASLLPQLRWAFGAFRRLPLRLTGETRWPAGRRLVTDGSCGVVGCGGKRTWLRSFACLVSVGLGKPGRGHFGATSRTGTPRLGGPGGPGRPGLSPLPPAPRTARLRPSQARRPFPVPRA